MSLGKAHTPTYAGTAVVIDKANPQDMVSAPGEPYYNIEVPWSVRVTYDGEFIHDAYWNVPWSTYRQGGLLSPTASPSTVATKRRYASHSPNPPAWRPRSQTPARCRASGPLAKWPRGAYRGTARCCPAGAHR